MKKMRLSRIEERAVREFKATLEQAFGQRIHAVTIFGSRARGKGHEFSDIDILILVDQWDWAMKRRIWDFSTDVFQQYEIDLSPVVLSEGEYLELRALERTIVMDIEREGVPL